MSFLTGAPLGERTHRRFAFGRTLLVAFLLATLFVASVAPLTRGTGLPPAVGSPTMPSPAGARPTPAAIVPARLFTPLTVPLTHSVVLQDLPAYRPTAHVAGPPPADSGRPSAYPGPRTSLASVFPLTVTDPNSSFYLSVPTTSEGINANQCGCAPPDVQVGVGPTQELEMVNLEGALYGAGGNLERSFGLSSFFGTGSDFLSDPKVVYDNGSHRWFASIFDFSSTLGGSVQVAASSSSDPNGTWSVYAIASPASTFPDQPILGVSSKAVAVSGDIFSTSGTTFYGAAYWVLNKSQMLGGVSNLSVQQFGPDPTTYELHPVLSVSTSPDLFVTMTNYLGATSFIQVYDVAGVPPANLTVTLTNVTVSSIVPAPSAVQPGTSEASDTGDSRVQTSVWNHGTLWLGFNDQCQLASDTAARACVRLVSINTTTDTVLQDFDVSLNGSYLYYPALAVSADGFVSLIVGTSNSTLYPSLLVTGRLPGDAVGTVQPALWLVQGSASQTCGVSVCRYGDYFGAGSVPGTSTAWVAGEYGGTASAWQTRLGEVTLRGPVGFRLTASPPSVEVGQSTLVTLAMLNSTCRGTVHCSINVPLDGAPTFVSGCVTGFTSTTVAVTFPLAGNFTLGSGGWASTYSAANCTESSRIVNVTVTPITVHVDRSLTVSVGATPPGLADVGQVVQFQAVAAGGVAPYGYHWTALLSGCADSGAPTVSCVAQTAGPVTVRVQVQDGHGVFANGTLAFWIDPAPSVSVTAPRSTIELGQILELDSTVVGGSGTFDYLWSGLPSGCAGTNLPLLSCLPTQTGSFLVNLTVTDSTGYSVTSAAAPVFVLPPLSATLSVSSGAATAGDPLTFTAAVTGGLAPYSFSWSGLPAGCSSQNSSTISCTPSQSGNFSVTVSVGDALGGSSRTSLPVLVSPANAGSMNLTYLLIALLVVIVIVVAAVTVLLLRRRRR